MVRLAFGCLSPALSCIWVLSRASFQVVVANREGEGVGYVTQNEGLNPRAKLEILFITTIDSEGMLKPLVH